MPQNPKQRRLGRPFDLPPRWRWVFWPMLALTGGGMTLAVWDEGLTAAECVPFAALPGMAALLYGLNRLVFRITKPHPEDLVAPAAPAVANVVPPMPQESSLPWHTLSLDTIGLRLKSIAAGLTQAEAARRLAEHGPNELPAPQHLSPWALLAEQFKNVLIIILLVATALSAFLLIFRSVGTGFCGPQADDGHFSFWCMRILSHPTGAAVFSRF